MDAQRQTPKGATILVVEDDRAANDITCRMIAMEFPDAVVHSAENGALGEELFKRHAPDLVITDVSMPVKNGIELARTVKALKPETGFIVLSAYNEKIFQEKFRELGIHTYLLKPIDLEQLLAAIHSHLDGIRQAVADRHLRER